MTGAGKSLRKGFILNKNHIIPKWEIIIWDNDKSGDIKGLAACKCEYSVKSTSTLVPSTTYREINSYVFLDIVQIRLQQNILLARAVSGAERLNSKQIHRSG